MAIIKCKMCGGELSLTEGSSTAECEYCGTLQTIPQMDDEKKLIQFERAERLRKQCEFDKAAGIYETIVADFRQEAEAYWGLVLCKYGIEYVDDPATGKKIPTCHRSSFDSIMEDSDFEQVLENADVMARRVYREEAKAIDEIRKGIISVSSNEQPYDIFICYKETDETGNRTLDSVLAQDVYDALTDKGYRVFFSRITLEDKLGVEYEPYIFAALNSAKIMLAFGTDYEYFNAVWVKNEWSRFLKMMVKDKEKHLIPCYKGIDAYDMPKEFAKLQAQDLGKVGAIQDLLRGIEKLLGKNTTVFQNFRAMPQQTAAPVNPSIESYLKRVFIFLDDGNWSAADEYCEKVLDIDPENPQAYLGKLLTEYRLNHRSQLADCPAFTKENSNYKKLIRYGNDNLKAELAQYLSAAELKKELQNHNSKEISQEASLPQFFGVSEEKKQQEEEEDFRKNSRIRDGMLISYCGHATELTIPYGITAIAQYAFRGCKRLTRVIIPDSVTTIYAHAFDDCSNLTGVTLPNSVTTLNLHAFAGCFRLTSITVPSSVTTIHNNAFITFSKKLTFCTPAGSYAEKWAKKHHLPVKNIPV